MNNKLITAIVCLLIVICLAVGVGIHLKGSNEDKETSSLSDTVIVSETVQNFAEDEVIHSSEESAITSSTEKTSSVNSEKVTQTTVRNEHQTQTQQTINSTKSQITTATSAKKSTSQAKAEKTTRAQFTVVFSINCERAAAYGADVPAYFISRRNCVVEEGATVFDLLMSQCGKNGIPVVHQNKSYVSSIGGLAEKDCGNASGWVYTVNGVKPMMAASKYVLKDGDTVEWYYVTSPTD